MFGLEEEKVEEEVQGGGLRQAAAVKVISMSVLQHKCCKSSKLLGKHEENVKPWQKIDT